MVNPPQTIQSFPFPAYGLCSRALTDIRPSASYALVIIRLQDERHPVRELGHPPEKEAALGHKHRSFHTPFFHGLQSMAQKRDGGRHMALGGRKAGHPPLE